MVHTEGEHPTVRGHIQSSQRGRPASPELGIGQMKLEPPSRFNGAKKPGVGKWIDAMTTWLTLMNYPTTKWVLIASTRLEGHALSWYTAHARSVTDGIGRDWYGWAEFCDALRHTFAPLDDEEDARRQLKELRQTGKVAGYTAKFNELCYRIPGLTEKDRFSAYHLGLVPKLQAEVGLRLEGDGERTGERATIVATRAKEYLKLKYGGKEGETKKWNKPQKPKGTVNVVTQKEESAEGGAQVNAVDKKGRKRNQRGKNRRGRGRGRAERGPPKCFCCGGEHLLRDCTEWKNIREQCNPNRQQGQGNA